jgi:hypothetical protein
MQHPSMYRPSQPAAPRLNNYLKQAQTVKGIVPKKISYKMGLQGLLSGDDHQPPRANKQS